MRRGRRRWCRPACDRTRSRCRFSRPHPTRHVAANESPDARRRQTYTTALVDKPPPLAVSVYEPVYFIVGGDGGLNAKFQISLRYQLFDDRGGLAQPAAVDRRSVSVVFADFAVGSGRAVQAVQGLELSAAAVLRELRSRRASSTARLRLGVETGFGHESNGKEGDESRSFNMFYVRPTLTFGDPDGLRFYVAPLIHNYIADDENPDLEGLSRLRRLGARRRQQGRAGFLGHAAQGHAQRFRQRRAECCPIRCRS